MAKCPHGVEIGEVGPDPDDVCIDFFTPCDCCDYLMNNATEFYYNQQTGEALCSACEPIEEQPHERT